jgi:hypothetical protein
MEENFSSSTYTETNTCETQKSNTDNEITSRSLNSDAMIETTPREKEEKNNSSNNILFSSSTEKNSRHLKNPTENVKNIGNQQQSSINREWPNKKHNMSSNSNINSDMSKNRNTSIYLFI